MRRVSALLLVWGLAGPVQAQEVYHNPIVVAMDPSPGATGYRLDLNDVLTDIGNPLTILDGEPTIVAPPMTLAPGYYGVSASAYNLNGESEQAPMPPLAFRVVQLLDPACVAPLGNRVVSIVPTTFVKTGSKGAGSQAYIMFRTQSPNSPVVHESIRASLNGGPFVDLVALDGTDLAASGSLWFTLPAVSGTYSFAVAATNLYGCSTHQGTVFTATIP